MAADLQPTLPLEIQYMILTESLRYIHEDYNICDIHLYDLYSYRQKHSDWRHRDIARRERAVLEENRKAGRCRLALVSHDWCNFIQGQLFRELRLSGLRALLELKEMSKRNPRLATYPRVLSLSCSDSEGLATHLGTPILTQYSEILVAMMQQWDGARQHRDHPLKLSVELVLANSFPILPTNPTAQELGIQGPSFIESLTIKTRHVSKAALDGLLPPAFHPGPILKLARGTNLKSLSLQAALFKLLKNPRITSCKQCRGLFCNCSTWDSVGVCAEFADILPKPTELKSLERLELELFLRHLPLGTPDDRCAAIRHLTYNLVHFKAYISHLSTEIFSPSRTHVLDHPNSLDGGSLVEEPQSWNKMKSYSLLFGAFDTWDRPFFYDLSPSKRTYSGLTVGFATLLYRAVGEESFRFDVLEPLLQAAVEALMRMPVIEVWEIGLVICAKIELCVCLVNDNNQPGAHAPRSTRSGGNPRTKTVCSYTKGLEPLFQKGSVIRQRLEERWPWIVFDTFLGSNLALWNLLPGLFVSSR